MCSGSKSDIKNRVKMVIDRELAVDSSELLDSDNLTKNGYLIDSLSLVNLVVGLESEFDIIFEDEQIVNDCFSTIIKITDIVIDKLNKNI